MTVATVNGLDLHYEVREPRELAPGGEPETLLLAHGYCASTRMWRHTIPALASRYRVVAYDARGHGLSGAPAGREHYTLEHLRDDLVGLLDSLGIERAHLAGHSMGGATVAAVAARHPQRVLSTLVCNIDAGHLGESAEARERADNAWKLDHARRFGMADLCRRQIERGAAPRFVLDDPHEMDAYVDRYARQPLNGYLGTGDALPWRAPWLAQAAAGLDGPVLVVAGLEDPMHEGAGALHRRLPRSRLVLLEGAPHDSVNARPAAFNAALLDFLDDLTAGRPLAGRRVV